MSTSSINASVLLSPMDLPSGLVDGEFQFTLTHPNGSTEIKTSPTSTDGSPLAVTFSAAVSGAALPAGAYTLVGVKLSTTGVVIGTAVSASITIPADVVVTKIYVPTTISLSLA